MYPFDGPIPAQTTTLESPLRFGFIGYASVQQPLTQQYKIGLGIELAKVGVDAAAEQIRAKRQAVVNEVRRLYYGIAQAESAVTTSPSAESDVSTFSSNSIARRASRSFSAWRYRLTR